ncbi:MAG: tetratricopeptide repeat protein [Terrimicrobiaceae bacterium]
MHALKLIFKTGMLAMMLVCVAVTGWSAPIEAAAEAYQKGDFALAVREYETAISSAGPSAGLYFNLGMASKKAGNVGSAALALRRALLLNPRSVDTRMALSDLERSSGIALTSPSWSDRLAESVPLVPLLVAGFLIFWLGMFIVLVAVWLQRRPWMFASGVLAALIGAMVFVAAYLSDPRFAWRSNAVVMGVGGVTMGQAPAERSQAVAKLPEGTMVSLLRKSGDWAYCRLPDGRMGWLPMSSVQRLVPGES